MVTYDELFSYTLVIIGIIGLIGCGVNYPIYKRMLGKSKAKYAYEIVELARQISEQ